VRAWHRDGLRVALVPTMGNLHSGHVRLIEIARAHAERCVASIFVNPTQFGPSEDFARYPRTPREDERKLADAGCDLVFMPEVAELYPHGGEGATRIEVPGLSGILDGEFRPGHFAGVATVVSMLFHIVEPDIAIFGEKDYQQLTVIRRMVADLCMPVEIVGAPTVRAPDGLALSSRNQYLTESERALAPTLYATLEQAAKRLRSGDTDIGGIEREGMQALEKAGFRPEYVSVRQAADLAAPAPGTRELVVLVAARLGKARLIDNLQVTRP
jgi:pantoate--beta-alanine ligase